MIHTSDGALLKLLELALHKAQDQAGFSNCGLPKQHQLKLADLVGWGLAVWPNRTCCHGGYGVIGWGMGV